MSHDFKARWVPCAFCLERIKLCSVDGNENHVVWMHQKSDDQEFYRECIPEELRASPIGGLKVAYPFVTC